MGGGRADAHPAVQRVDGVGGPLTGDRGSAIVDFVLVSALLTLVFVALIQLTVVLHVRNTLIDCAGEGARHGALSDRLPADGARRARDLIGADLSPRYAEQVSAGEQVVDGLRTVVVEVRAPLPVAGLLGAGRWVTVTGHAVREGQ